MQDKIQNVKNLKRLLIEHFGDHINEVILFGSQTTGKASKYSDYDILIILKNDYDHEFRREISNLIFDQELKYDLIFDEHLLSVNEIETSLRGAEPVYMNAIKNGIYV